MREAEKYELAEIEELDNDVQDLIDNPDKLRRLVSKPTVRGEKRAIDHIVSIGAKETSHTDPVDYIKDNGDKGEIKAITINEDELRANGVKYKFFVKGKSESTNPKFWLLKPKNERPQELTLISSREKSVIPAHLFIRYIRDRSIKLDGSQIRVPLKDTKCRSPHKKKIRGLYYKYAVELK